jgi:hypothetical protein
MSVTLFSAVTSEDIRAAQVVTGAAMALFIGIGIVPGLREYAGRLRLSLLVLYLLACSGFVAVVLLR